MVNYLSKIQSKTYDLIKANEACSLYTSLGDHQKLNENVRNKKKDAIHIDFTKTQELINQLKITYQIQISKIDKKNQQINDKKELVKEKLSEINELLSGESKDNRYGNQIDLAKKLSTETIQQIEEEIVDRKEEFLKKSLDQLNGQILSIQHEFDKQVISKKQAKSIYFLKNCPKQAIIVQNEKLVILNIQENKEIKELGETNQEIICAANSDTHACICFENSIWIVDINQGIVTKKFKTKAKSQTIGYCNGVFIIWYQLNDQIVQSSILPDDQWKHLENLSTIGNQWIRQQFCLSQDGKRFAQYSYHLISNSHQLSLLESGGKGERARLRYISGVSDEALDSVVKIFGEIAMNKILYYDFKEKSFKLWNTAIKENDSRPAKVEGLFRKGENIVEIEFCQDYYKNNYMIILTDQDKVALRRVRIVEGEKMSVRGLRRCEDMDKNKLQVIFNDRQINTYVVKKDVQNNRMIITSQVFGKRYLNNLI